MATQWTAQGITSGAVLPASTLQSIGAAWVDYTPTLTQGVTVTKTVVQARYCQFQKTIIGQMVLNPTSAGTLGRTIVDGLTFCCPCWSTMCRQRLHLRFKYKHYVCLYFCAKRRWSFNYWRLLQRR
jgi:hypothetical protein